VLDDRFVRDRQSAARERPLVSVVLPAFHSQRTLARCLEALAAQSWREHEVILVDSSPDGASDALARRLFPEVHSVAVGQRLLAHAARNRGAAMAQGDLLVFSDPDVYAHPNWLEQLITAHRATGDVIVGALDCWGSRWLDRGVHLCKFAKWLPGQRSRYMDMSPTANMLVAREDYAAAGPFPDEEFLGDITFSRHLLANGQRLRFEPAAVVAHHHLHSLKSFLGERFYRGRLYGGMRAAWLGGRPTLLVYFLASVLPIRLLRILGLVALQAARSGWLLRYLATWPLVMAGHEASLVGEAVAYAGILLRPPSRERTDSRRVSATAVRRTQDPSVESPVERPR
jgi:GT2 family glycosyltransferase